MKTLESARSRELLKMAADNLDEGMSPFATDALVEHNVTFTESAALSGKLATIIRGYLRAPVARQSAIWLLALSSEAEMPAEAIMAATTSLRLTELTAQIEAWHPSPAARGPAGQPSE